MKKEELLKQKLFKITGIINVNIIAETKFEALEILHDMGDDAHENIRVEEDETLENFLEDVLE